jgi:hypothetical protein
MTACKTNMKTTPIITISITVSHILPPDYL